ncbi:protein PAXX isoform X4 [Anas platyrhynchos]|uniref:protein PAXX isoform X4 n=1 Tax=Anas platyrhynchos TaxID=8839 RepID=UPI003AF2FEAE
MAEPPGPFCVLGAGPGRYLCYCCPAAGPGSAGTVCVTDALEVWAGELGARPPQGRAPQGGTGLPEDGVAKLREALRRGAVSLSLQEGGATLQLQGEAGHSTLHLCKLPVAEARTQLQALMFGLATSIKKLEERLEVVGTLGSSCSPEKNASQSQQLFLPGNSEPPLLWLLSPTLLLVPFPAQEGPGLSMVALEVHCAQVRCLVSPSRVACWPPGEGQASLLFHGSSVSPWSFHIGDQVWPLIIHGSWRHILGTEGLAGLPKQPADLCFPYPSCL